MIVRRADLGSQLDADAVLSLLQAYAMDPMGGGDPLSDYVSLNVIDGLRAMGETCRVFLAFADNNAVGLAVCFVSFSTFKAKRLLNIHDFFVRREQRGKGIAQRLLHSIENESRVDGFCKITLEVLSNNIAAQACYKKFGFEAYVLQEEAGHALFWQKNLL